MKPPFSLLLVHGDGSRVVRVRLPRWLVYGTCGSLGAAFVVMAALSAGYVLLKRQGSEVAALRQRVEHQREVIAGVRARIATVREEITTWRAAHAKMWEALGPETGLVKQASGVGGAIEPELDAPIPAGPRPLVELDHLASTLVEDAPRVRELEDVVGRMGKMMSALPLRWPVRGRVNSEYGKRSSPWTGRTEHHSGLDIGARHGTPVLAPAAATVVLARSGGDYGKHIKLDHGHGVRSLYGHLSRIDVRAGQRVERGQVLGLVGSTGRSTGPHLHYEVRVNGDRVNPRRFLWDG
jgi:murein DD-endopeptidase MepM/ murein hydrolase activator NlpD